MRVVLYMAALIGCGGGFWHDLPAARVHAAGGDPLWTEQVSQAVVVWNTHLRLIGCPPPFVMTMDEGHPIVLVPVDRWRAGDAAGQAHADTPIRLGSVTVVDRLTPVFRSTVLLHELGHAIGLDHAVDANSIMHTPPVVSYISYGDVAAAAEVMRCGPFSRR